MVHRAGALLWQRGAIAFISSALIAKASDCPTSPELVLGTDQGFLRIRRERGPRFEWYAGFLNSVAHTARKRSKQASLVAWLARLLVPELLDHGTNLAVKAPVHQEQAAGLDQELLESGRQRVEGRFRRAKGLRTGL